MINQHTMDELEKALGDMMEQKIEEEINERARFFINEGARLTLARLSRLKALSEDLEGFVASWMTEGGNAHLQINGERIYPVELP